MVASVRLDPEVVGKLHLLRARELARLLQKLGRRHATSLHSELGMSRASKSGRGLPAGVRREDSPDGAVSMRSHGSSSRGTG